MLANNVCVNALDGDASLVSNQPTQAGGVQNGTGGQHAVCGQAGNLLSHDGENVTGVGDEHDNRVGCYGQDVRQQLLEDCDVCACQFEAGLAGLLASTSGDDDHVAVAQQFDVVATGYGCFVCEHCAVCDVQCFSVCALAVDVVQDDFICGAADHSCVCGCATDAACTDDAELGGVVDTVHCCMPSFRESYPCGARGFSRGLLGSGCVPRG
ncbi:Uncharacterised protein [Mycobacterium tuberculosis]|nr:Uncharacterised protein [Mycobacterium tuberculosis]